MQERYSEEVKSILEAAQQQAVMNYQQELSCAHILVALSSSEGFFRFLLANVKADERNFAQEAKALMQRIPSVKGQDRQLVMSTALARVLGLAAQAAGQGEVNVGNLVAALAGDGDSETVSLLKKYGIDKKKVEGLYMAYTNGQADEESKQTLEKYGQDLTAKAMEGKLDPVIGRDEEIRRVIEILSRRKKNNPVLIGEPGVGKTAIAEGLARRIVAGDVPENLKNKTLYALDLAALVAGAKYRGEFEERMNKILKEIEENDDIILFIDEIHTLVGAGKSEGAMDAANILKPALAGGFSGTEEWIRLAEARGIGWWVTSALESNIGLSALAQWTYGLQNPMPQGLGTGLLYTNNIPSPLQLTGERLYYRPQRMWDLSSIS